jgi:hypothetical protein
MHQRGRLERLPRLLIGEPRRGQLPQFVIDQRQELLGSPRVALGGGVEDGGDLVHRSAA